MLLALVPSAWAQNYPTRVITLISPFPPGGPSDTAARLVVGPMSKALGQQIIVENVTDNAHIIPLLPGDVGLTIQVEEPA
jgi:tripartite-type tricarboxylate transporter receptor subunit TctC